jgi:hypothetical protein
MDSKNDSQLQQQRDQILDQMRALDQMRRGSLSRQFFASPKGETSATQGPYFVLQGYLQGRKFSQRIAAAEADVVETQVANYKRFQELADQFVTVTEQITLQAEPKKNSARTSKPSVSRRRPPSSG